MGFGKLEIGDFLQERQAPAVDGEPLRPVRQIELLQRNDPYGAAQTPTWRVRNTATGHESVIQESNISERFVRVNATE